MSKKTAKATGRKITSGAEREAKQIRQDRGTAPQAGADQVEHREAPRTIEPKPVKTAQQRRIERGRKEDLPEGPIKVRATRLGYYDHVRRHPGDVFTIKDREAFSFAWMELAPSNARETVTTANASIKRQHDDILGARVRGEQAPERTINPDDVLGDD